ncbi:uncharacterized protein LOC143431490 [Xylocopa sonorina]|uniref:uncharacterized protein LOC143431490 n=1 Tax=Xylocopa sonorina TaxID=1818115 RepID=UPI00403AA4F9
MYETREERRLRMFQRAIPNATSETLSVFENCMKTDAIYKVAFPYGLTSAAVTYFFTSKKSTLFRYIASGITGFVVYNIARLTYAPICCQKAIRLTNVQDDLFSKRKPIFYKPDKQEAENNFAPTDSFAEEQDTNWSNFDTGFDSTSYEFNDINYDTQEEATPVQQKSEKKHVTYDDLWSKHKQDTMDSYTTLPNPRFSRMPIQSQKTRPNEMEELIKPETENEEKNVWH